MAFTRPVSIYLYISVCMLGRRVHLVVGCSWVFFLTLCFSQAPPDGMQNIIWAFSRTPPGSADADTSISVHHMFGNSVLNLTRVTVSEDAPLPSPVPSVEAG